MVYQFEENYNVYDIEFYKSIAFLHLWEWKMKEWPFRKRYHNLLLIVPKPSLLETYFYIFLKYFASTGRLFFARHIFELLFTFVGMLLIFHLAVFLKMLLFVIFSWNSQVIILSSDQDSSGFLLYSALFSS